MPRVSPHSSPLLLPSPEAERPAKRQRFSAPELQATETMVLTPDEVRFPDQVTQIAAHPALAAGTGQIKSALSRAVSHSPANPGIVALRDEAQRRSH